MAACSIIMSTMFVMVPIACSAIPLWYNNYTVFTEDVVDESLENLSTKMKRLGNGHVRTAKWFLKSWSTNSWGIHSKEEEYNFTLCKTFRYIWKV
jgi:hypothetical protein